METRMFLDAFSDAEFSEAVRAAFSDVKVTRVVMFNQKMQLRVSIESKHLIEKEDVYSAEDAIAEAVFGKINRSEVVIDEYYVLSELYTPETLMRLYYNSFLTEIARYNHVMYRIVKRGEIEVNDNIILLNLEDLNVSHMKSKEIIKYFEGVFLNRFGMEVEVRVKYYEGETKKKEEWDRAEYADRVRNRFRELEEGEAVNADGASETSKPKTDKGAEKKANDKGKGAKSGSAAPKKGYEYANQGGRKKSFKWGQPEDPDCFYGHDVSGDCIPISQVEEDSGLICIKGQILSIEDKELRSGKLLYTASITDFTDTINIKLFIQPDDKEALLQELAVGKFYKVKGVPEKDSYPLNSKEVNIPSVKGIKAIPDFREERVDDYPEKRVELHMHTVFSESDSVVDIGQMVKQAKKWGHKAVAITDHAVAQAFPVANHALDKGDEFKIIYGLEGYFVDDLKTLVMNTHEPEESLQDDYVVFDIETTGLSFKRCKIIEIGAVRVDRDGKIVGTFSEFVNPEEPIPYNIEQLTSINDSMVKDAPTIEVILPRFLEFCKGAKLVAHNATFDTSFIRECCHQQGLPYDFVALDTMTLAYVFVPEIGRYNLDRLCKYFNVVNAHHHRACDDADVTAKIFLKLMELIRAKGITTVGELNEAGRQSDDMIRKAKTFHGTILVKNEVGRVNLYRLISESHIRYFQRFPRLPMSLIEKYREGLMLGSGCARGELYSSILDGQSDEEIARLVKCFDFLEVQPIENNMHLIDEEKVAAVRCVEDLQDINRRIIELGKQFGKPVVATGDVHFLNPEDAIYRAIISEGSSDKGPKKKEMVTFSEEEQGLSLQEIEMRRQPPLYYRTTREMLDSFSYLDLDLAKEIVIKNSNMIADMIEKISPVRPDKCPPVIENSDKTLRDICENKAHEIYGPDLPEVVSKRLEKELNSIIGNGYSVMYIIAQKLVWKSNDDGYLVGSRGSVGSSFAATMAGITEVNPLSPHYICPHCFYTEFDSERVIKYSGMSGCDMPDADCPKCGTRMKKEGHDIPFETFLGFKGDKEPDIDLNFSGEYQPKAHAYIEEIFGKGHAFRAGTISTYAEKTVFGYVLGYCEKRGIEKRHAEINRLVQGCLGVKRTTGQHPGGMIVLPDTEEIYSFSPIQKPANDMSATTTTTHFEYHSIDHNLLKFDILGHDDPTMIRRLEDLTGIDAKTIPLDDKRVMDLFHSPAELGITSADIDGVPLGSLGIPEFGTEFAMQMVVEADPQSFSDLVRISGLSHGTDVWLGNAQTLIQQGICKLSSAICCRDDIMVYLIHMGLESGEAFQIMEKTRKGIVAKGKCGEWPEWKEDMLAHGVPEWYIGSCEKIKYMFPKAHAVAYVMMAWRIAYFKIYYPLAYYTAFFSIRATAFNYELMCLGRERLDTHLHELLKKDKNEMSAKEQNLVRDMRIVQEMYARGIEFMPIDIYKADDTRFQIIDGKIMPSFASLDGMGGSAAQQLKAAAAEGVFLSQEELKNRAHISGTVIDKMAELGILGDMPKQSQLTFDFLQ